MAISRLQSHQLSSLEQTGTTADGRLQTTWQLEIPMRTLQDIVPLQVKFQREEPAPDKDQPERKEKKDAKQMLWRVELAFDMEPLGPLQVQAPERAVHDQHLHRRRLWLRDCQQRV